MGPKLPKAPSPSRVKSALRALINRPGIEPEAVDYFQEVLTGFGGMGVGAGGNRNDRGAAILLATNLENSLRIAIERKLAIDAKHRTMLFEEEASPLRDFAAKIRMGYAIGLFGNETKKNLDMLEAGSPCRVGFVLRGWGGGGPAGCLVSKSLLHALQSLAFWRMG